jgi:hypothetical protein
MSRARLFSLVILAAAASLLASACSDGPARAEPEPTPATLPLDAAFDWQARVICDWPQLPEFRIGETAMPRRGEGCAIAVLAPGQDPTELLRSVAAAANPEHRRPFSAWWAAPDEATAKAAEAAGIAGISGGVGVLPESVLPLTIRPAVLLIGPDGEIRFAHVPGSGWEPALWRTEAVEIVWQQMEAEGNPMLPQRVTPKPQKEFRGALYCAACHRNEFKDWLMTPHSAALRDLVDIRREEDAECIGCHVVGWQKEGGYSDRARHRWLADVQCEACHLPERTHGANRIQRQEWPAICETCHTAKFSFFTDIRGALEFVSHPQRDAAAPLRYERRSFFIGAMKQQMFEKVCGKTEYVGSDSCRECHGKAHAQWKDTPHARAWKALEAQDATTDETCFACHTTGHKLKKGFVSLRETPDRVGVGCESCHGPGLKHVEAKSVEERKATVFAFDEKCPTCVVQRICMSCHDQHKRPCFEKWPGKPFVLAPALDQVRHREK